MKKITLLFFLAFGVSISSFAQNCQNPISNPVFQNIFNQVAIMPSNQKKLEKALELTNVNCLLSSQVKSMAQLFTEDSYRLEYCKTAYSHTFDQANYYEVYDAFGAFSWAFRLHDFIHPPSNTPVIVTTNPTPVATDPVYPNYAYPDPNNYTGKKGCPGPVISDAVFKPAAKNVFIQPTDESRMIAIQTAYEQYCLSFAQIMKLASLLQSENLRLKVLQNSLTRVYDQEHYQSGMVLFSSTGLQNEWIAYAKAALTPPPPPCLVTAGDFNGILKDIQAKSFPDDKMGIVKLLAKDRCFSVEQIRSISKEFAFGEEKLTTFKAYYEKCTDKNNYYKLVDELTFSSEKDNLRNFIKNDGH